MFFLLQPKPLNQFLGRVTIINIVVANLLENFRCLVCITLLAESIKLAPLLIDKNGVGAISHLGVPFWPVEAFHVLDRIAWLTQQQPPFDHFVQVDKNVITQQLINFIFTYAVAAHQFLTGGYLVVCIVINMHTWILLPALINPANKILKALLLLGMIMGPEINELAVARLIEVRVTPKVFQSTLIEGIAFNIKENIQR